MAPAEERRIALVRRASVDAESALVVRSGPCWLMVGGVQIVALRVGLRCGSHPRGPVASPFESHDP
ncbi:MAG: hypothetical protein ACYDEN_01600, partial [Acidimicrobiales bacterium]